MQSEAVNQWLDADQVRALAESLLAPGPPLDPLPNESMYGKSFEGFAAVSPAEETSTKARQIPSEPQTRAASAGIISENPKSTAPAPAASPAVERKPDPTPVAKPEVRPEPAPVAPPQSQVARTPVAPPQPQVARTPVAPPQSQVARTPVAPPQPQVAHTPVAPPQPQVARTPVAPPQPQEVRTPVVFQPLNVPGTVEKEELPRVAAQAQAPSPVRESQPVLPRPIKMTPTRRAEVVPTRPQRPDPAIVAAVQSPFKITKDQTVREKPVQPEGFRPLPLSTRLQAFGAWLKEQIPTEAYFICDRNGEIVVDEVGSEKLVKVARTLAHASSSAGREVGDDENLGSLHVKIGPDRVMEVVPRHSHFGLVVLGLIVPRPLSREAVGSVSRALGTALADQSSPGQ